MFWIQAKTSRPRPTTAAMPPRNRWLPLLHVAAEVQETRGRANEPEDADDQGHGADHGEGDDDGLLVASAAAAAGVRRRACCAHFSSFLRNLHWVPFHPTAREVSLRRRQTTCRTVLRTEPGRVLSSRKRPILVSVSLWRCYLRAGAPGPQEVADHVLAETVGHGPEHPAAISLCYLINERAEPFVVSEHKDIESSLPPGHLVDLGHGEFDRLRRRRPVEPGAAVPRRCAVGSPSVMTSTTGLCSGRRSRNRPARTSAWCRFVPWTMSQPRPARSVSLSSLA